MLTWAEDEDFPGDWFAKWQGRSFAISTQHLLSDGKLFVLPTFRLVVIASNDELIREVEGLPDLATAKEAAEVVVRELLALREARAALALARASNPNKRRKQRVTA